MIAETGAAEIRVFPNLSSVCLPDSIDYLEGKPLSMVFGTMQEEVDDISTDWILWSSSALIGEQIIKDLNNDKPAAYWDYKSTNRYYELVAWSGILGMNPHTVANCLINFWSQKLSPEANDSFKEIIKKVEPPIDNFDEIASGFVLGIGRLKGLAS